MFFEVLWGIFFQVSWGTLFLFLNVILFFFLDYDTVDVLVCALICILFFIYVYLFIIFFTYFLINLIIFPFLIFRLNVLWNLYVPVWKQYLRWIDLKIFYWTENGLILWIDFLWTQWHQNYWDHLLLYRKEAQKCRE